MSYRINYQSMESHWSKKRSHIRLPLLTVLCFLLFLWMVNHSWQEGADFLRSRLYSLKETAAAAALDQFAVELYRGEPLASAFSEFREMICP